MLPFKSILAENEIASPILQVPELLHTTSIIQSRLNRMSVLQPLGGKTASHFGIDNKIISIAAGIQSTMA